ncbi:MAG: copper oxidase [Hyphomicrobiales bacterium]|nr:copper oxidase [Hyphomicrobiales bacterium]
MFLNPKNTSRIRLLEAERARENRLEMVKAMADGEITKRDLFRWGVYGATGLIAAKHGLSPFVRSAYAAVPTGTPASPLFGAKKFHEPLNRAVVQPRIPILAAPNGDAMWMDSTGSRELPEMRARRLSYHDEWSRTGAYKNPVTGRGPCEGRPPGEFFAHQRWTNDPLSSNKDLYPKVGYLMSLAQCQAESRYCGEMPAQNANSMWSFGPRAPGYRGNAAGSRLGYGAPCLIKARYGEPLLTRIYNDLPVDRKANGGFGRNEISTHFHNAHNGAESDGACNAYHFPGTFYDYHWGTTLARRDMPSQRLFSDPLYAKKASGPTDDGGLQLVEGDFRELQGTLWFHDHRFFFTAENVHKGNFALCNYYSGPDRACTAVNDGVNLMLPSGSFKPWGNQDFDVNLAVTNPAFNKDGQLFFDIFDTDGFLGDMLCVNGTYYPYMEVLPRRYRFRILNAAMSRFIQLAVAVNNSRKFSSGTTVPFYFIANDGNLVVNPIQITQLDEQGVAERYDIVIDFSAFADGDSLYLVNLLQQTDGRKPDGAVSMSTALKGTNNDPCVGPIMEFRVRRGSVKSVDDPTYTYSGNEADASADFSNSTWKTGTKTLTSQIPVVAPVRERVIEFNRSGGGDSRDPKTGQCIPECGDIESFPWAIKINGQASHSLNANRIGALVPKPGEVEYWTLVNGGGGWDHPIHLHFEEGITLDRGSGPIGPMEKLVRKDVWRLRPGGTVRFQVRFGEFGGSYVNHCHNTVHEDFAMLLRYQLLTPPPNDPDYAKTGSRPHWQVSNTPMPSPDGVTFKVPEILPEADPKNSQFFGVKKS